MESRAFGRLLSYSLQKPAKGTALLYFPKDVPFHPIQIQCGDAFLQFHIHARKV
jgi:hypothetical protein